MSMSVAANPGASGPAGADDRDEAAAGTTAPEPAHDGNITAAQWLGGPTRPERQNRSRPRVAEVLTPLIAGLLGEHLPIRFEFWDGSTTAPPSAVATIRMTRPDALRRILWMPNELGLGRAYVAGDLELDGDLFGLIIAFRDATRPSAIGERARTVATAANAARRLGLIERPLPPPPEEARISGWRHSLGRDAQAISHHYDVGNDFYRLVLGPTMTYSCARFVDAETSLEDAQTAKYELICRKLGLHQRAGTRLLDVGCGWGSMALHAAAHHGARVVGITISRTQAALARQRVADAGLSALVEIRLQDYRELAGERFDAISSIGMSEHVGQARLGAYFETLRGVLAPQGRLLNHAISAVGGSTLGRNSFVGRYVFPDGELADVGNLVLEMEQAGFEVRDVESLREHYARTLRQWVTNIEADWDKAVELAGAARAKIWRLYMAGSAIGFEDGGIAIHQALGVLPTAAGDSGMPATRHGWG
jgi:cyclopropane-fatty-acyl-phospholipid synthase